jgi:hypothetical protein
MIEVMGSALERYCFLFHTRARPNSDKRLRTYLSAIIDNAIVHRVSNY